MHLKGLVECDASTFRAWAGRGRLHGYQVFAAMEREGEGRLFLKPLALANTKAGAVGPPWVLATLACHRRWAAFWEGLLSVAWGSLFWGRAGGARGGAPADVPLPREEKVYTTSVETHFFFVQVWGFMVYTLPSGPMVYTLFPCFPKKMVYTLVFFCSVTSGSGDRPRKRGVPPPRDPVVVYTLFSLGYPPFQGKGHIRQNPPSWKPPICDTPKVLWSSWGCFF